MSFTLGALHARRADALEQTFYHDEIEELLGVVGLERDSESSGVCRDEQVVGPIIMPRFFRSARISA